MNKLLAALPCFLAAVCATTAQTGPAASIPVKFTIKEPGFVTLVVEDMEGRRVRNLIGETPFPAGENTVSWDGLDDLDRDMEAAARSVYRVPGRPVPAGKYRVRGLVRPAIELKYEMTPYSPGNPPWHSDDESSGWLANHTPPSAVLFVPESAAPAWPGKSAPGGQIVVAGYISEGSSGSGLAWLNLEGAKLHGRRSLGEAWTGASHLTRDDGTNALAGIYAYAAAAWDDELRLHMLGAETNEGALPPEESMRTDRPVLQPNFKFPDKASATIGGLAARNGLVLISLRSMNQLLFVDARRRRALGTTPLQDPRGLAFDEDGRLLALSGNSLLRFETATMPLPKPKLIVSRGLDDPQQIALDAKGNIYISDRGAGHQVKVFTGRGRSKRRIGVAGKPGVGPYDPNRMNNPNGLTVSADGHLWVAESDYAPKRVSVWDLNGGLIRTFHGPPKYGGGGTLDPADKSRFFYADVDGCEFKLDWQTGTSRPVAVYYRHEMDPLRTAIRSGGARCPETPIHLDNRDYLTDAFNINPVGGASPAVVWLLRNGVAVPAAMVGSAADCALFGFSGAFSVRWTGRLMPRYSEKYTLAALSDAGIRVWLGGRLVIDDWKNRARRENMTEVELVAGKRYDIRIEYCHANGNAVVKLYWQSASQARETVPQTHLFADTNEPKEPTARGTGLTAQYYDDRELARLRHTCVNGSVNFDWGDSTPAALLSREIDAFGARLPPGANLKRDRVMFAWSDMNEDATVQPEEITTTNADVLSVAVMSDLSIITGTGWLLKPQRFTTNGVPVYDAGKAERQIPDTREPVSSGCGQALYGKDGWTVLTTGPMPFAAESIAGGRNGKALWSYPNLWPGLHASRNTPTPEFPGELIGTTRLLGAFVTPRNSDLGEVWAINGNRGNVYLFTSDGLFVATLFQDGRKASPAPSRAARGMSLTDVSQGDECFWPTIAQTGDGEIYVVAQVGCIVRVQGLEKAARLPPTEVEVTAEMLKRPDAGQSR